MSIGHDEWQRDQQERTLEIYAEEIGQEKKNEKKKTLRKKKRKDFTI